MYWTWVLITSLLFLCTVTLGVMVYLGLDVILELKKVEAAVKQAWFNPRALQDSTGDSAFVVPRTCVYPYEVVATADVACDFYLALVMADLVGRIDVISTAYRKKSLLHMNHPYYVRVLDTLAAPVQKAAAPPFGFVYELQKDDVEAPPQLCVVARGTTTYKEVNIDLNMNQVLFYNVEKTNYHGLVHAGFYEMYDSLYRKQLFELLKPYRHENTKIMLAGHSLGGAIVILMALDLALYFSHWEVEAFVFGSPRVGNRTFHNYVLCQPNLQIWRFFNTADLIQDMPPAVTPNFTSPEEDTLLYEHVGEPLSFTLNRGTWQMNHRMETYIQAVERLYAQPSAAASTT